MRRKRPAVISSTQHAAILSRRDANARRLVEEPFEVDVCRDASQWEGQRRVWAADAQEAYAKAQADLRSDEFVVGLRPLWESRGV